jgi:uncharacterized protein YbbC (DUF1343 family)
MIEWEGYTHPQWGIPVYSLYGQHREPTPAMLEGLDALLVDMQDVGARYYTFIWTLFLSMKACEKTGKTVVVLDRPNPLGDAVEEGPIWRPEFSSFVGLHPLPVRHGLTIGQVAQKFRDEAFPQCDLRVLEMENWNPKAYWDETGLPWVMPSPNMPTLDTALVYPGMCLFEATQVSEGRGTTRPFELFGAPWIRAREFCDALNAEKMPGVLFREAYFQPTFHKFKGELCSGAHIHVLNREVFRPVAMAIAILNRLLADYPESFKWKAPPYEYEEKHLPIEVLMGCPVGEIFPGVPHGR